MLEAGHGDLAAFIAELAGAASAATLGRKVACVRSFYRHLRREGLIAHDPIAELRGPRKTQRLPRVLTRQEVAKLMGEPKGTEPRALRDRALLEILYACGLRVSEAIGLELADVDLAGFAASGLAGETMRRGVREDELFFAAALAGGAVLAEVAEQAGAGEDAIARR